MNIFGLNITTKKRQLERIAKHDAEVQELKNEILALSDELFDMVDAFPFYMGQVVYDVALKNAQGRYTKTKPSREHCTITEVEVTEKNYFSLKKRLENDDVFYDRDEAVEYLDSVCENV
jgi:hypothetical protein